MCGICGRLMMDREARVPLEVLKLMANTMIHRGPDDEGYYSDGPVGLGFRRLSIIDLSGGHQPLCNEDGTVWIVFNGEIYNYQELRSWLLSKGHQFKTQSDTEVIVHLYEEYGEECVSKLRGMFGFAIWDANSQTLFLARDRVGIKPLYYTVTPDAIVFASEIKAILADPAFNARVAVDLIDRFLTFDYMPGEETLFQGIKKLNPGSYLKVKGGCVQTKQYWDLNFQTVPRKQKDAEDRLIGILEESVRLHMISDVPVGFLLSGGLDSTAMLSLAGRKTDKPISSYTVGFAEEGIVDERPYARIAAERFRSQHYEISISSKDFADFLPKYIWHMEEPVCEPPAVSLYYVSRLAREHVTVLVSGEGGDEAFAGYPNYRWGLWAETIKKVSRFGARALSTTLTTVNQVLPIEKFARLAFMLNHSVDEYYWGRTSSPNRYATKYSGELYSPEFNKTLSKAHSIQPILRLLKQAPNGDAVNRMLYVDTKSWLPDDLLIKADKITMANSVELRVPLLDHEVLEFAASLPSDFKVRAFETKYLAKRALSKHVPKPILKRKKAGFPTPFSFWLRRDLRDWAHDILFSSRAQSRGYFKNAALASLLDGNFKRGDYSKEIFSLVVLEMWHREFIDNGRSARSSNSSETSLVGNHNHLTHPDLCGNSSPKDR